MPLSPPEAPPPRGAPLRVVLFQRDEDQSYAASFLLGILGWPTLPHRDPETLVEVCRAYRPHVVFMEADAEGHAPTSAPDLRSACDDQDLVVVVIAGSRIAHDADWASTHGFDAVVHRPFLASDLVSVLRRIDLG